MNIISTEKFE